MIGTVAKNVLAHGTGALNINAGRISTGSEESPSITRRKASVPIYGRKAVESDANGRWPANVILQHLDECEEVGTKQVKGSPPTPSGFDRYNASLADHGYRPSAYTQGAPPPPPSRLGEDGTETVTVWECEPGCPVADLDQQSPGVSRFFYCAKASKAEKGEGNTHPTVKPVKLMRHLCRLVTPPGGLVVDPFTGSGTTGIAALAEGFRFAGAEKDPDYHAIAARRLANSTTNEVE